eukprot:GSChrysophyteH1.ASY1.ANO1.1107.1 assembled CDS
MGKNAAAKKKRKLEATLRSGDDSNEDPDLDMTYIFEDAAALLHKLTGNVELYRSSAAKPLRAALHALLNSGVMTSSTVANVGSESMSASKVDIGGHHSMLSSHASSFQPSAHEKIASALRMQDWHIAVSELALMRSTLKKVPKIGTLQRWVNFCDGVFTVDSDGGNSVNDDESNGMILALDAILRTADVGSIGLFDLSLDDYQSWIQTGDATHSSHLGAKTDIDIGVLQVVPAEERIPVNLHDLIIWFGSGNVRPYASHSSRPLQAEATSVTRESVFLANILTPEQCRDIIDLGEYCGFDPDVPKLKSQTSVLANAFVWICDEHFINDLWSRVKSFLPAGALGLNRRFRCYRYKPGAVYRPHIDGAWPPSGAPSDSNHKGKYVYDTSDGKILSKYTFLIYLNQGFEGGCTTFYAPSDQEGVLDRRAVVPMAGSALIFPHGASGNAALHEGSAVTAGIKYVIRTEVLYPINVM